VVKRALSQLPAEQRQVLELGYFEGLSSTEIAERIASPVGTVKSRVAAALSKLRAVLGCEEDGK
jgi:RNA polymerase sigma-70 factor (ECF subfamily)